MPKEFERDGQRVIRPQITRWDLKGREKALFAAADTIPNWRLADKSRRLLADMSSHLSSEAPSLVDTSLADAAPAALRQFALITASGIVIRSIGSAMAMIACGYTPEAGGPARRCLEARLNAQAILEDPSGQYAIQYLKGRPRSVAKLAREYGASEDVRILSILTHADARGLTLLHVGANKGDGDIREGEFSIFPIRNASADRMLLYVFAYEANMTCAALAEAFGVTLQIPPWVSRQLEQMRDELRQWASTLPQEKKQPQDGKSTARSGSTKALRDRRRADGRRR